VSHVGLNMWLRVCRSSISRIDVCFDAINMLLMARCACPFTNKHFPSATLISTLRIFKEQAACAANLSACPYKTVRRP